MSYINVLTYIQPDIVIILMGGITECISKMDMVSAPFMKACDGHMQELLLASRPAVMFIVANNKISH